MAESFENGSSKIPLPDLSNVHVLQLAAYAGPVHTSTDPPQGKQGIPKALLEGTAQDGGQVTYNNDGSVSSWKSADGLQTRTFTYQDMTAQLADGPQPGEPVNVLNGGQLTQIFLKDNQFVEMPVSLAQLGETKHLSHVLERVSQSDGSYWLRDQSTGQLKQYQDQQNNMPSWTGRTATDGTLLPQTILKAEQNRLYADNNHAEQSVRPYGVNQGALGDCYFEAALANMAAIDPEAITSMIRDNHDGTYTVSFPRSPNIDKLLTITTADGEAYPQFMLATDVTVDAPTAAELQAFNRPQWSLPQWRPQTEEPGVSLGYWATVIEKAHRYMTGRTTSDTGDQPSSAEMLLTGGATGLEGLTNFKIAQDVQPSAAYLAEHPGSVWSGDHEVYTPTEVATKIKQALAAGRMAIASTEASGDQWIKSEDPLYPQDDPTYLLPSHAYSVARVIDATADHPAEIVLRNPWGVVGVLDKNGSQKPVGGQNVDGYFEVSADDFSKLFGRLDISAPR